MPKRSFPEAALDDAASDDELARACISGDAGAWAILLRRYGAYIYSIAVRAYRLDPNAAEEVFQDTCVRIYDGLRGYRGSDQLRPWIRQVAISACRDHARRAARHPGESLDGLDPAAPAVADLDEALDVRAAVQQMGDPCRATIELAFFEDRTQADTARRLGVPEGTVAARISRCLKKLREDLQGNQAPAPSRGMR